MGKLRPKGLVQRFLILPAEFKFNMLESVIKIPQFVECPRAHFNEELNTLVLCERCFCSISIDALPFDTFHNTFHSPAMRVTDTPSAAAPPAPPHTGGAIVGNPALIKPLDKRRWESSLLRMQRLRMIHCLRLAGS